MMKVLAYLLVLVGGLSLGIGLYVSQLNSNSKELYLKSSQEYQVKADRIVNSFLQDQQLISTLPFFARNTRGADAGVRLNDWVTWQRTGGPNPKGLERFSKPPAAFAQVTKNLISWKDHWIEHFNEIPFQNFDFSWLDGLLPYSIWDIEAAKPVVVESAKHPEKDLTVLPQPAFAQFDTWMRLRFMKAIRDKKFDEAVHLNRKIVELLLSTENTTAVITGLLLLKTESQAYQFFKKKWPRILSKIPPLDPKILAALDRNIEGAAIFINSAVKPETLLKVFPPGKWEPGLCAAFNQVGWLVLTDRILAPALTADTIAALDQVLNGSKPFCRLKIFRQMWQNQEVVPGRLVASYKVPHLPGFPWLNQILFSTILTNKSQPIPSVAGLRLAADRELRSSLPVHFEKYGQDQE